MSDLTVVLGADSSRLQKALNEAKTTLHSYRDEVGRTSGVTKDQVASFEKSVNALNKINNGNKSAVQQMKALENQIVSLTIQYNSLGEEAKNDKFGKALADTINETKARFSELQTTTDSVRESLHDHQEQCGSSSDALSKLSEITGVNIGTITKLTGVVGLGKVAIDEMKEAVFLNESAIDEWGRTVKAAEAAHNTFLHALNSGNWSNFFNNLQAAIRGARQLYNEFDRLGSIKANNAAAIALVDNELAQLRKLKKEGKDVQKQIDDATSRRAALVKEGVVAGKTANRDAIVQTLKQYNPRMSDSAAQKQADSILHGGQKTFDAAEKTVKNIEKYARDHYGKLEKSEYIDGQTVSRKLTQSEIMSMLPKNLQGQYRNAKAIIQSETKVQPFISGYASSVQEGTSNTNSDLKFTPKDGGGSKSGSGSSRSGETELEKANKIAAATLEKISGKARSSLFEIENTLPEGIKKEDGKKIYNQDGTFYNPLAELLENIGEVPDPLRDWNADDVERYETAIQSIGKEVEGLSEKTLGAAEVVGQLGSAFSSLASSLELPELNVAGVMAQSIANMVLSYSEALKQSTSLGPWAWIGFGATGLAQLAAMISTVKSIGTYADGGIIKGATSIGDFNLARVNSGEMILNGSQQGRLFNLISGNSSIQNTPISGNVEFKISGNTLVGVLENYGKKHSRL